MKRLKYIVAAFIICMMVSVGCGNNKSDELNPADYFPMKENMYYEYAGEGNDGASMQAYVTYIGDNRAQRRVSATDGNISVTEVIEYTDDAVKLVYTDQYRYHLEDLTSEQPNLDFILLQAPLKLDATWQTKDINGTTLNCKITDMSADVTVPYGTFKAIEVTTEYSNGYSQKDYYVRDVGLVKTVYTSKTWTAGDEKNAVETSMSSLLIDFGSDNAIEYPVTLMYPDEVTNRIYQVEGRISLRTNTDGLKLMTDLLNAQPEDAELTNLIDDDVKIMNVSVDDDASILSVDFSENFYDRKMDIDKENTTLQCIANTLGQMYKVYQFELTVGGKAYKSDNITLNAGDYIEVEYQQ